MFHSFFIDVVETPKHLNEVLVQIQNARSAYWECSTWGSIAIFKQRLKRLGASY